MVSESRPCADISIKEGIRNSRFALDPADDRYPLWSPDGASLAFTSNRNGVFSMRSRPTFRGSEQILLQSPDFKRPNSWSPDGRFLLYWVGGNNGDLMGWTQQR